MTTFGKTSILVNLKLIVAAILLSTVTECTISAVQRGPSLQHTERSRITTSRSNLFNQYHIKRVKLDVSRNYETVSQLIPRSIKNNGHIKGAHVENPPGQQKHQTHGLPRQPQDLLKDFEVIFTNLNVGHSKKDYPKSDKSPFNYDLIKNDVPIIKQIFAGSPQDAIKYNNVKYVRDKGSQKIFAVASSKRHDEAVVGRGASGTVKLAMDIDNPASEIVIKRNNRHIYFEDMTKEAQKLHLLDMEYGNIKTPIESHFHLRSKDLIPVRKQYQVMQKVKGITLEKYLNDPNRTPEEIHVALGKANDALVALNGKGYVHMDSHLNNFIISNDGKSVRLIDVGRAEKIWDGLEINYNIFRQKVYDHLNLNTVMVLFLDDYVNNARKMGEHQKGEHVAKIKNYVLSRGNRFFSKRNPLLDPYMNGIPNHFGIHHKRIYHQANN